MIESNGQDDVTFSCPSMGYYNYIMLAGWWGETSRILALALLRSQVLQDPILRATLDPFGICDCLPLSPFAHPRLCLFVARLRCLCEHNKSPVERHHWLAVSPKLPVCCSCRSCPSCARTMALESRSRVRAGVEQVRSIVHSTSHHVAHGGPTFLPGRLLRLRPKGVVAPLQIRTSTPTTPPVSVPLDTWWQRYRYFFALASPMRLFATKHDLYDALQVRFAVPPHVCSVPSLTPLPSTWHNSSSLDASREPSNAPRSTSGVCSRLSHCVTP